MRGIGTIHDPLDRKGAVHWRPYPRNWQPLVQPESSADPYRSSRWLFDRSTGPSVQAQRRPPPRARTPDRHLCWQSLQWRFGSSPVTVHPPSTSRPAAMSFSSFALQLGRPYSTLATFRDPHEGHRPRGAEPLARGAGLVRPRPVGAISLPLVRATGAHVSRSPIAIPEYARRLPGQAPAKSEQPAGTLGAYDPGVYRARVGGPHLGGSY